MKRILTMGSEQKEFVRKYLISILGSAAAYSIAAWKVNIFPSVAPGVRFFLPILVTGLLFYFLYVRRFSAARRNGKGTFLTLSPNYLFSIIFIPSFSVMVTDSATQKVQELNSISDISPTSPEYFQIKKWTPLVNAASYTHSYSKSYGSSRSSTRLKWPIHAVTVSAYVPVITEPQDTAMRVWLELEFDQHKSADLTDAEAVRYTERVVKETIDSLPKVNFNSIVFFSRRTAKDTTMAIGPATTRPRLLVYLWPHFESLHDELLTYSGVLVFVFIIFFGVFVYQVSTLDNPEENDRFKM